MNSKNRHKTTLFIASSFGLLLQGCGATQAPVPLTLQTQDLAEVQQQPPYLQGLFRTFYAEGQRNAVLNRLEIGSAAFFHGDIEAARVNFDEALGFIESTFANNENALKARSLWHEEGRKDYRGEAYERAMAYYYRGLVYLIDGEYDNARASFTSALLQDAFAEEEHDRADFALMMYLIGWSSMQMGSPSLAQEAWEEMKIYAPDFEIPQAEHNVLVIAETGTSPRKLADGVGGFELVYRPGKNFQETRVTLNKENQQIALNPLESIYIQASTRGSRDMDKILASKASFRSTNESMGGAIAEMGTTARVFAPAFGGNSGQIGNALSLIGVSQLMLASNAQVKADTRYWRRLPDTVHVKTLKMDSTSIGQAEQWQAEYTDNQQQAVAVNGGKTHIFHGKNGQVLIWHKSREI